MLEKVLLQRASNPNDFKENNNPNFKKYIGNGFLAIQPGIDSGEVQYFLNQSIETLETDIVATKSLDFQKCYVLVLLRNKFAHNQLPTQAQFQLIRALYHEPVEIGLYATYFNDVVRNIISELSPALGRR